MTVESNKRPNFACCLLFSFPCRKKLAKRSEELEALQKECDRRSTLLGSVTAEKEKLAAALAAAQAKLRRVGQEAAAAAAEPALKVDAAKVGKRMPVYPVVYVPPSVNACGLPQCQFQPALGAIAASTGP
jgi:hypothetical protein